MKRSIVLCIAIILCGALFGSNLKDRERLVFEIKYGFITAGEATLNIQKTEYRNVDAWRIFVTAETNSFFDGVFRVRDFIESMATYDNLYSLRFTKRLQEGRYRQHRIMQNYLSQGFSTYSRFNYKTGVFTESRITIPSNTYDLMSAFYYIRTQNLAPGNAIPVNVSVDGKSYDAIIHVERRETIDTLFGRRSCVVIRPALQGDAIFKQSGDIFIWLTDDADKVPVLLQSKVPFGHFRAVLSKVETVA